MNTIAFKDLQVDDLFQFAVAKVNDYPRYKKTSARCYHRVDVTGGLITAALRVGTIRAECVVLPSSVLLKPR